MTDAIVVRLMAKNLFIVTSLVPAVSPSFAEEKPKTSIPTIAGNYVNVYKPVGDVFPGP